jgi:hypothetical protein
VVADFVAGVRAVIPEVEAVGEELAAFARHLTEVTDAFEASTKWLLEHGAADPNDALAAATPYLQMLGLLAGGWVMARQAVAAKHLLDAGDGDPDFLRAKLTTARFYGDQLLPQALGLGPAVEAGAAELLAVEPKYL